MWGAPGQVGNVWAPLTGVVCQGRPRDSLILKQMLGLDGESCKKSKSGRLSTQEWWVSATYRELLPTPGSWDFGSYPWKGWTVRWLGRKLAGLRQSQVIKETVTESVSHPSCLCSAHCPRTHLLPNGQEASQCSCAFHLLVHYLFSSDENIVHNLPNTSYYSLNLYSFVESPVKATVPR